MTGPTPGGEDLVLSEDRLQTRTVTDPAGAVRAVKHVSTEAYTGTVERGVEHAETEHVEVPDPQVDSGQVETLPDGSLSIPVFEEQVVITKRLVVRERVVVRKRTVVEEQVVTADLRRERLEVETDGDVVVRDEGADPAGV